MASITLRQAAARLGTSKPTLLRAIRAGRLSATRNDDGSFTVDEAELARAFPDGLKRNVPLEMTRVDAPDSAVLRAETEGLRAQLEQVKGERDDLRRRLDAEAEERRAMTALLTDQRQKQRRWWWW